RSSVWPASPGRESGLVRPPRASVRYTLLDEVTGAAMDEAEEAPPDRRRSASALLAALRRRTPH
ncbi:MAG: hypothetical protein K2X11_16480, partial [Acetobacteraceae bacterium]|nr:hypothetical protein [Acetobacteraceae bacterium]